MTEFTSAPWEWVEYEYGYSVLWNPNTGEEILVADGVNDGDSPIVWMGEQLSEADRNLIKAAPDMFLACSFPGDYGVLLNLAADIIDDVGHERQRGIAKRLREKAKLERAALELATK